MAKLGDTMKIPVAGPSITEREVEYAADAVRHAWFENANMYNEKFERAFSKYIGVDHAVSLPSCTSAIHLSLAALGVGPGDEVIVPDATWIASAAPISYVGATPVFVDVEADTWCLSPESFEQAITMRTKAVIPVGLYGSMPDFSRILSIAEKHQVAVIEDAAEALGSELNGRRAGSFGRTGVFSFHGSKTLTTGEGGMLVTNDEDLFQRVLFLRDHGRKPGDRMFENKEVAFKYKMSAMQAAVGLAQIERVEDLITRKREIFAWYREGLKDLDGVTLNAEPKGVRNSYWMVTAIFDEVLGLTKKDVMARLEDRNIDSRPFFSPLSSLKAYADLDHQNAQLRNPVSYQLGTYGVNLPSGYNLTKEDVGYICGALADVIREA